VKIGEFPGNIVLVTPHILSHSDEFSLGATANHDLCGIDFSLVLNIASVTATIDFHRLFRRI
jgi:hypothetical protein